MEIQEIITRLKRLDNDRFPRQALRAAIDQSDEVTPELLGILENVLLDPQKRRSDSNMDLFFAMFLLAQFREQRACPLICQIVSLPDDNGKIVSHLLGDIVTEGLPRILASVSGVNWAPLKAVLENPSVYEYTRSSTLKALTVLMYEGVVPRDELVAYFLSLFQGGLDRTEDPFIWASLIRACHDIYPKECYEEICKAYDECIVETFFIRLQDVEYVLEQDKDAYLASQKKNYCFFSDTFELASWICFKPAKSEIKRKNKLARPSKGRKKRKKR